MKNLDQAARPSPFLLMLIFCVCLGLILWLIVLHGKYQIWKRDQGGSFLLALMIGVRRGARLIASLRAHRLVTTTGRPTSLRASLASQQPGLRPPPGAAPVMRQADPTPRDWMADLLAASFIIIRGKKRSGKTVITHHIAVVRALKGARVLGGDPDMRPGMWPGCAMVGGGDQWAAIESQLQAALAEISRRRELRNQGQRTFDPWTIVMSEAADIFTHCPSARLILEALARRGEKLGLSLLIDVQDTQAGTLDLDGATHLLKNVDILADVSKAPDGQRSIAIDGERWPIPALTDPEALADSYQASLPPVGISPSDIALQRALVTETTAQPLRPDETAVSVIATPQTTDAPRCETDSFRPVARLIKAGLVSETKAIETAFAVAAGSGQAYKDARAGVKKALADLG